jgi:hypothetical protein
MKRFLPLIVLLLGVIFVASTLFPRKAASEYDLDGFGRLPVLVNGRIKPLDTVARTTLLTVQGRQRVVTPDGKTITPTEWLLNVCFTPGDADKTRCFEIVHPDVLALLNLPSARSRRRSPNWNARPASPTASTRKNAASFKKPC